jgi:hypothetical protein
MVLGAGCIDMYWTGHERNKYTDLLALSKLSQVKCNVIESQKNAKP